MISRDLTRALTTIVDKSTKIAEIRKNEVQDMMIRDNEMYGMLIYALKMCGV